MGCFLRRIVVCVCLIGLVGSSFGVSKDEIAKMTSAMPEKAAAQPKAGRKVLVFSLCKGFKHGCIPYWSKSLSIMGRKTGAFETVDSKDMSVFNAASLEQFDAICFNNTTHLEPDEGQQKAIMDFIKGGKGIVGIHAATDNFYKWPEGNMMMGGVFTGHPWTAGGTWSVKIDEPGHPLMKAFEGKGFKINDEIYRTSLPQYSRSNQRVLMSLDMSDETTKNVKGVKPEDMDTGISWVKSVGKGRLFYCSLGHNNHITWNGPVLEHYLAGIQFAMGDLDVDTAPIPVSAGGNAFEEAVSAISKYEYGQSRKGLIKISNLIGAGQTTAEMEKVMTDLLGSDATLASKQFICRQLSLIGTDRSVATLAGMVTNEDTSDMARYALERIATLKAAGALRGVLDEAKGKAKIGVISSLGNLRDGQAAGQLAKLIYDADEFVGKAAIAALGNIANEAAGQALKEALGKLDGDMKTLAMDSYLKCGDELLTKGQNTKALAIYNEMFAASNPSAIRAGATKGLILSSGKDAVKYVARAVSDRDGRVRSTAIVTGAGLGEPAITSILAELFDSANDETKVQILTAIARSKDERVLAIVTEALKSENESVKIAAHDVFAVLGDKSYVSVLAAEAGRSKGKIRERARQSLYSLGGQDINSEIVRLIPEAAPEVSVELIKAAVQRGMSDKEINAVLIKAARGGELSVKKESYRALRAIGPFDILPSLVQLLVNAKDGSERAEAEKAVIAVAGRAANKNQQIMPLIMMMPLTSEKNAKISMIRVLGEIGNDGGLGLIRRSLNDKDSDVRTAVIRALSDWPKPDAIGDLLKIAETGDNKVHRVLALRGFIKQLSLPSKRDEKRTIEMYQKAKALSVEASEKMLLLSSLSGQRAVWALKMAQEYLKDESVRQEAEGAVLKIRGAMAPFVGNWQGSGKAENGEEAEFVARVISLGGNKYRMSTFNSFDTGQEPMHVMDGVLKDNKFIYTADNGVYEGEGILSGEVFRCYYKGPVNGEFEMHRVER